MHKDIKYISKDLLASESDIWINPVGGYGDILMISGAMKLCTDFYPGIKLKLLRRTQYLQLLDGHPSLSEIGYPPADALILTTDYWSREEYKYGNVKAYAIMAKIFGIENYIGEELFLHHLNEADLEIINTIPWKKLNILIATGSESPRKMMNPLKWHKLVEDLSKKNILVIQAGSKKDLYIKGTYSLLGVTTPRQLIAVMEKIQLVVTLDNFVMHTAKLVNKPALVLFGPTSHTIYGYNTHHFIQASTTHCPHWENCIGNGKENNYTTLCPMNEHEKCMNLISNNEMLDKILTLLN